MTITRRPIGHCLSLFLLLGPCVDAIGQGIPVIDAANVLQTIQAVAQLKQQVESQMALYQSLTGARGMGALLANPALANYLPPNWGDVYSQVRSRGYGGLSPAAQAFRGQTSIYSCAAKSGQALALCNHELNKNSQDVAFVAQAYARAQQRVQQLDGLRTQIDASTDAKAIADLNARLAVEAAAIGNEQAKLQLYKAMSDTEDRLIAQQKHELGMQRLELSGTGGRAVAPLTPH
jgi:type IV secretion system protein VirB5